MELNDHKRWYNVVRDHHADDNARTVMWEIICRKCHTVHQFSSGGASEDKHRKRLIVQGWEINKRPQQHLCPRCNEDIRTARAAVTVEPEPVVDPKPEPKPARPFLQQAWEDRASPQEQADFLSWLHANKIYTNTQTRYVDVVRQCQTPPPPILSLWKSLSTAQKMQFLEAILKEGWIVCAPHEELLSIWGTTKELRRQQFIDYLKTTPYWPSERKRMIDLVEHYRCAGALERERLHKEITKYETKPPTDNVLQFARQQISDETFIPDWSDEQIEEVSRRLFKDRGQ